MADVPHFEVEDDTGGRVHYRDIWQRAELLLVCLAGAAPAAAAQYRARVAASTWPSAARVVVTGEAVPGLPAPGVVIADRWGEIQYAASADTALTRMPDIDELEEWLRFVPLRCPECEGEWR